LFFETHAERKKHERSPRAPLLNRFMHVAGRASLNEGRPATRLIGNGTRVIPE